MRAQVVPWAYRADLWRYAVLYQCGGVYLDSKFVPSLDFLQFLNRIGFHKAKMRTTQSLQLYSAADELATTSIRDPALTDVKCVYQAFLAAEPRHPLLLATLQHVVRNVRQRWYPPRSLSDFGNLFITGPCAMGIVAAAGDWNVSLTSRLGYKPIGPKRWQTVRYIVPDDLARGRDPEDEIHLAAFVANERLHSRLRTNYSYSCLFDTKRIYKDDHNNLLPAAEAPSAPSCPKRQNHSGMRVVGLPNDNST